MQRASRFAPSVSDFEDHYEGDASPQAQEQESAMSIDLTPLNEFFAALIAAGTAVGKEPPRVPYHPYELPVTEVDEANHFDQSWHQESPEGLGKRGAAHLNQLCKHTTGGVTRYDLTIDHTYESVSIGVMVVSWRQVWGSRKGFGVVPYFRYVTSGGDPDTRFSLNDFGSRQTSETGDGYETVAPWQPDLEAYIARTGLDAEKQESLRAIVRAVLAIQPVIIGWLDSEDGKMRNIWTTGEAAKDTILTAVENLRKQDLFYAPETRALRVRSYCGR